MGSIPIISTSRQSRHGSRGTSFDPVALDLACADAANAQPAIPGSKLDNARKAGVTAQDNLTAPFPHTSWRTQIIHGKKIGLGEDAYELITV